MLSALSQTIPNILIVVWMCEIQKLWAYKGRPRS